MGKHVRALVSSHVQSFHCIGGDCPDTCCQGWRVDIDKGAFDLYQRMTDPKFGPALREAVVPNTDRQTPEAYATLKMNRDGKCPLLTGDGLCSVHKDLGPQYLSHLCLTYPRKYQTVDGRLEKSANISCPEVSRLALLQPEGVKFEQVDEPVSQILMGSTLQVPARLQPLFWDIRLFCLGLLQERAYTIPERLIGLGLFVQSLQRCVDRAEYAKIPELILRFTRLSQSGELRQPIPTGEANVLVQMKLVSQLFNIMGSRQLSPRSKALWREFLEGIGYRNAVPVEQVAGTYKNARESIYLPFLRDYEYLMENYLVHQAYTNVFPFNPEGALFQSYAELVVDYSLLVVQLVGRGAFHGRLWPELVVESASMHAREMTHNAERRKDLIDWLKKSELFTLGTIATMLA